MFRVGVLEKRAACSSKTLVTTKPHGVISHKIIIFRQTEITDIRIKFMMGTTRPRKDNREAT
jgi:hypothetical protein